MAKVDPPAPVIDAFRDVQRALADRERLRNEAEAYRNDILPRARGEAAQIKQEADAYRAEIIARAQGDADRFLSVYNAYKQSEDVTLQRLYLETMEEILKNSKKIIIDKSAQGSTGVLPLSAAPRLGAIRSGQRPGIGSSDAVGLRSGLADTAGLRVCVERGTTAMNTRLLVIVGRRAGRGRHPADQLASLSSVRPSRLSCCSSARCGASSASPG